MGNGANYRFEEGPNTIIYSRYTLEALASFKIHAQNVLSIASRDLHRQGGGSPRNYIFSITARHSLGFRAHEILSD